jgi:MFS family permease
MSLKSISLDVRLVLASQAVRAFGYGFGSVLLASTLAERGLQSTEVGQILGALVGGNVIAQLAVARWADGWGRRRSYGVLFAALGLCGLAFATTVPFWVLVAVALTGALSAEVIESGPFASLELSMLSGRLKADSLAAGFGWYNAIAASAGSLGALAAALPDAIRSDRTEAPPDRFWFLIFIPIAISGMIMARSLSPLMEAPPGPRAVKPLGASRPNVTRLAGLFALDAFGGGFVIQSFIGFWLIDASGRPPPR